MKMLVATKETQGQRLDDFSFTDEGELVRFPSFECDHSIDGRCGCRRSMAGTKSRRATTTMKIVDSPMSREQFEDKLARSLAEAGWLKIYSSERADEIVREDADELLKTADAFQIGDVIEKRGNEIKVRKAA